jgi:outer membrane lipoprotein-sorting protein
MKLSRRSFRWAVPVATVVATIGVGSLSHLVSAGAQVPAFSGSVQLTTKLGLPDLGGFGSSVPSSITDLLSGKHSATIAADGPTKVRVTMKGDLAESVWVRNGNDAWSWNSQTQTATHADASTASAGGAADAKDATEPTTVAGAAASAAEGTDAMSPPQMAADVLAQVDPSTTVSVRTSAYIAGRAAYELVLAPKSAVSTVSEIVLGVDAATGTPLDVRVVAKGQSVAALELGFTSITFATPAASTFVFTPPAGATIKQAASLSDLLPVSPTGGRDDQKDAGNVDSKTSVSPDAGGIGGGTTTVGTAWDSVMVTSGQALSPQLAKVLGSGTSITLPGGATANLVSTALVNVMLTSDGRMAIGAVNADTLKAALSQPAK